MGIFEIMQLLLWTLLMASFYQGVESGNLQCWPIPGKDNSWRRCRNALTGDVNDASYLPDRIPFFDKFFAAPIDEYPPTVSPPFTTPKFIYKTVFGKHVPYVPPTTEISVELASEATTPYTEVSPQVTTPYTDVSPPDDGLLDTKISDPYVSITPGTPTADNATVSEYATYVRTRRPEKCCCVRRKGYLEMANYVTEDDWVLFDEGRSRPTLEIYRAIDPEVIQTTFCEPDPDCGYGPITNITCEQRSEWRSTRLYSKLESYRSATIELKVPAGCLCTPYSELTSLETAIPSTTTPLSTSDIPASGTLPSRVAVSTVLGTSFPSTSDIASNDSSLLQDTIVSTTQALQAISSLGSKDLVDVSSTTLSNFDEAVLTTENFTEIYQDYSTWDAKSKDRILDVLSTGMVSLSSLFGDIRKFDGDNHMVEMVNELNYTALQLGGIAAAIKSSNLEFLIEPSPLKVESNTVTVYWCPGHGPVHWLTKTIQIPLSEQSVSTYSLPVVDTLTSITRYVSSIKSTTAEYTKTSERLFESGLSEHGPSRLLPTISSQSFIYSSEKSLKEWDISQPRVSLSPYGLTRDELALRTITPTPVYFAETSSLKEYFLSESSVKFHIEQTLSTSKSEDWSSYLLSTSKKESVRSVDPFITSTVPYEKVTSTTVIPSDTTVTFTRGEPFRARPTTVPTEVTPYQPGIDREPDSLEYKLKKCYENDVEVNDNFLENSVSVQQSGILIWRQFAAVNLFADLSDKTLADCFRKIRGSSPLSTVPAETVESLKKFDKLSGLMIAVMELGHCHNFHSQCTSMGIDVMARRLGAARLFSQILLENKKLFLPNVKDISDINPLKYGLNYAALLRISMVNEITELKKYLYNGSRISDNMPEDHLGALLAYKYRADAIIEKHRKLCTLTLDLSSSLPVSSTYGSVVPTTNLPIVLLEPTENDRREPFFTSVINSSLSESSIDIGSVPNYYPISLSDEELLDIIFMQE